MLEFGGQTSTLNSSLIPFNLKKFVSASSSSSNIENPCVKYTTGLTKNGESICNYYLNTTSQNEGMVQSVSDSEEIFICDEVIHLQKSANTLKAVDQSLVNKAMKFAQHNDLQSLQKMIDSGISVNATDEYGWSLLMVAACAGSDHIIKYLLAKNARRGRRDNKGNTALFLACKNNHTKVIDLLMKNKNEKQPATDNQHSSTTNVEHSRSSNSRYFCEKCNVVSNYSRIQHNTSIAHLLKGGSHDTQPFYGIPRSNIGFQMLLQQGWDDREGLGPDGSGRKYPIKTKQKKDRSGVGKKTKGPKNDSSSSDTVFRKEKLRLLSLKSTRKLLKNEKLKERELRRLLNEPDV